MDTDVSRRDFMKTVAGASAVALTVTSAHNTLFAAPVKSQGLEAPLLISMVTLPYALNALEPFISAKTVDLHYNKHHKSYYEVLKGWIGTHPDSQNQTLDELILKNKNGILYEEGIFNYSILLNNHNWYWQSLKPKAGGAPKGKIGAMINASYGSYDAFRKEFIAQSMQLGIGWVYVVQNGDKVLVYRSEYLDTPLLKGYRPLLAIDVWEHAYYIDYQNERQRYIEAILNNLLNWDFAEANLAKKL